MKFDIKMSNMVKGIAIIFMLAHHLFFAFNLYVNILACILHGFLLVV